MKSGNRYPPTISSSAEGAGATRRTESTRDAGETIERFFASGVLLLKQKLGPINWQFAPTKKFDGEDFEAFLAAAREHRRKKLRHAIEVRNETFRTPEFIAPARKYKVAVVLAGDSEYPQIADITAPFVYARIMGTTDKEANGYPAKALDAWAERARQLAAGTDPGDLKHPCQPPGESSRTRCYLYVISGFKERNPACGKGADRAALSNAFERLLLSSHHKSLAHFARPRARAVREWRANVIIPAANCARPTAQRQSTFKAARPAYIDPDVRENTLSAIDNPLHDREVGSADATQDTTRIDDVRIGAVRPLISPALLQDELPVLPMRCRTLVENTRGAIADVLHGRDDRSWWPWWPCSIHDHDQAMRVRAAS